MNSKKLHALYGLKWNPFSPEVPTEALLRTPRLERFLWQLENLLPAGGFALVTGEPGTGKSAALRVLAAHLQTLPDVVAGVLTRPQSGVADLYRELGDIFGVRLRPHNRWAGFKVLRERWKTHMESNLLRPVLLVDESQQMKSETFSELRILASAEFDSRSYLTVVLAGDQRLPELLTTDELVPLGSRIRVRLLLGAASPEELRELLEHAMKSAGNPKLMTPELVRTLVEHSAGNYRVMMNMAADLLVEAAANDAHELDEKLYFETFQLPEKRKTKAKTR
jgi:type II secretory pathway predicted ATPase ExeA